jgi:aspartyl aminopeptidase
VQTTLNTPTASPLCLGPIDSQLDSESEIIVEESFVNTPLESAHIRDLLSYIEDSPTAYQATDEAAKRLDAAGFTRLSETEEWDLNPGGKYYVTRNGASFLAFILPRGEIHHGTVLGAHTDSPGLKIKPYEQSERAGCTMWGVEIYGGPTLATYFSRWYGIAGRICVRTSEGEIKTLHVNIPENLAAIVPLAIHLATGQRDKLEINPQQHLPAITNCGVWKEEESVLVNTLKKHYDFEQLLSHDLFLAPTQKPELGGTDKQLLGSYRLDNLLGTHACLQALLNNPEASHHGLKMIAAWNHEEHGSKTYEGASGTFMKDIFARIAQRMNVSTEALISRVKHISIDVAHGQHPNYAAEHEPNNPPLMGHGVTIKHNANGSYATDAEMAAWLKDIAHTRGQELQEFVIRSDKRCGSTIGNIAAAGVGLHTIDIGAPILAMHAVMELGHCGDHETMIELLDGALNPSIDDSADEEVRLDSEALWV